MHRPTFPWTVALLGVSSIALFCAGVSAAQGVVVRTQEEEEEEFVEIEELNEVESLIAELKREEAEDALKEAKKALRKRKREKAVKAALEKMENNIEALEEFEKAKEAAEADKVKKALKGAAKTLRGYGEILFVEQAEALYADLKQKAYYIINDFETEEYRDAKKFTTSASGANVEVVSGVRFSAEGRHALKIRFDERGADVKEQDPASYRAALLKTPEGFSKELESGSLKALSFSVFSYKKTPAKVALAISGGGAESFALYAGVGLDHVGWRHFQVSLRDFRFNGTFQWRDARSIIFSTRGAMGVEFIVDDVKFLR